MWRDSAFERTPFAKGVARFLEGVGEGAAHRLAGAGGARPVGNPLAAKKASVLSAGAKPARL